MRTIQQGFIGFLLRKHIVRNQFQARLVLLACALTLYMVSGFIFFTLHVQSTQASDFVERYQYIDQSKFK